MKQREQQIEKTVQQALRGFNRVYSTPREDLAQQARLIALETAHRKPEAAENGGYLFTAVRRSLGNYVSKDVTIVSISGNWTAGKEHAGRASLFVKGEDGGEGTEERFSSVGPTPEELAAEAEADRLRDRWRVEFRRALDRAVDSSGSEASEARRKQRRIGEAASRHRAVCLNCALADGCAQYQRLLAEADEVTWGRDDIDRRIIERKFGLDGEDPWKEAEIAERLGIPVRRVYRTWEIVSRRLRGSLEMFMLGRRLEKLK